jgi:hypothetical protein
VQNEQQGKAEEEQAKAGEGQHLQDMAAHNHAHADLHKQQLEQNNQAFLHTPHPSSMNHGPLVPERDWLLTGVTLGLAVAAGAVSLVSRGSRSSLCQQ